MLDIPNTALSDKSGSISNDPYDVVYRMVYQNKNQ